MATGSSPQFDVAQFPGSDVCTLCGQPVGKSYYRVDGLMACATCAINRRNQMQSAPAGRFGRALLWGLAAAVAGLALYSTVGIVTGYEIGFVSLAVGFMVGKAVLKGSGGVGGRRYQIAALLLTYFAVSTSAVPIGIAYMIKQQPAQVASQEGAGEQAATADPAAGEEGAGQASLGQTVVLLLGLGLASPFMGLADFPRGLIGLIILAVGLQIAWKLTAAAPAPEIEGPFDNRPAAPSSGA